MNLSDRAKNIIEWIVCILVAFVLALLIRYYVGTPTIVQQPSMFPTLKENQRLILNRLPRTTKTMPNKGDIITFEAPSVITVSKEDYEKNGVIARYLNEPDNWFSKFVYYVLELNKDSYIKRVIGCPGDLVQIHDGAVFINGEKINEPYLQPGVTTQLDENYVFDDLVVPENCVFVMGDNRNQSTDSRAFGCIPLEKIESKVWIRFWPLNLFGTV